jgi:cell division protein FtsW
MTANAALFKGDRTLWILIGILMVFSLPLIYSATGQLALNKYDGNTEKALFGHMGKLAIGIGIMLLLHRIPYLWWGRLSAWGIYLAVILLLWTLLYGQNINEAARSVRVPVLNFSFQASDPARLFVFLWLARGLTLLGDGIHRFRGGWVKLFAGLSVCTVLIAKENMSTGLMLMSVGLGLIWIAGARLQDLAKAVGLCLLLLGLFVSLGYVFKWSRVSVWVNRMENFGNAHSQPELEDYQVVQAKIAVASAGFLGKGPGNSIQRNFLPHAYSDYVYAIVIEEYGLGGASFVLLLYLGLFYRIRKIAIKARTTYGSLVATGLGMALMAQAMVNMAVSVGLFPVTGQTLPFLSHGGSSILINAMAMGVVLSISRDMTGEGDWSELDLESDKESEEIIRPENREGVHGNHTGKELAYA